MDQAHQPIFKSLVDTTRTASQLGKLDIGFYKTLDKSVSKDSDAAARKMLGLASEIMQAVIPGELEPLTESDVWSSDVVHVLDLLADKVDLALNAFNEGWDTVEQKTEAEEDSGNQTKKLVTDGNARESVNLKSVVKEKPQIKFERKVNNSKTSPFKPLLTSKPNAIQSFEESMEIVHPTQDERLTLVHYAQPYETEIMEQSYPEAVKVQAEPIPSLPWETTEPIRVDTVEALDAMVEQLSKATEIAVDLEHHDFRSFFGFVCLMQISDRHNDFIVDTLVLRPELERLNTIFTNPNILKVLHGATMDIIWLQRDFGLYVVSLFDTYHASRALGLKRHGLAYLLEMYADFQTSKKYQLADWRQRPIPLDMLKYAQSDTHFLLNIYDQMRNELLDRDNAKMDEVLANSRRTAVQRYEIDGYDTGYRNANYMFTSGGWQSIANKYNLSWKQGMALEVLYEWRDGIAREEDESPRYIMPNHLMVALATTVPQDVAGVLSLSSTTGPRIKAHLKSIVEVLKQIKVKLDKIPDEEEQGPSYAYGISHTGIPATTTSVDSEKDFENYNKLFLQARKNQNALFSINPSDIMSLKSEFWGNTITSGISTSNSGLVKVEHIQSVPAIDAQKLAEFIDLNDIALESSASTDAASASQVQDTNVSEPEPKQPEAPKVFLGQSNQNLESIDLSNLVRHAPKKQRKKSKSKSTLAAQLKRPPPEDSNTEGPSSKKSKSGESGTVSNDDTKGSGSDLVAFDYTAAKPVLARAMSEKEKRRAEKRKARDAQKGRAGQSNNGGDNSKNGNGKSNKSYDFYGTSQESVKGAKPRRHQQPLNVENKGTSRTFKR